MTPRPRIGLLLAGVLAVVPAGCGGHAVTKSDVIARGNQICEKAASSIRSIAPPGGESLSQLARYYKQVTPIVQGEVKQLHALPRPSQDRAMLNHYLSLIASSASEYDALATAAREGDRVALASASATLRANPAASLAARYGLTGCAGSLGTAAS